MDRRFSRRSGISDETTIFTKDGIFTGILENISMGGLFLRTNKTVEVGDVIEVTIPLPDYLEQRKIVVDGIAVRVVGNGVALQFINLDDDTQRALLFMTDSAKA